MSRTEIEAPEDTTDDIRDLLSRAIIDLGEEGQAIQVPSTQTIELQWTSHIFGSQPGNSEGGHMSEKEKFTHLRLEAPSAATIFYIYGGAL